jgi:adenylate kinase family enzyme
MHTIKGLFEFLSKLFGKKNIIVIQLDVHEHVSKKRNAARFTCSLCALPRLAHAQNRLCSFCDAPFKRRDDDAPEVTHARFEEYYTRTLPIVSAAKRAGYTIKKINGEKLPFAVFKSVRKAAGI